MSDTPHKLIIRSPAGVKRLEVGDFEALAYSLRVNAPGSIQVRLRGGHPALSAIEPGGLVEVWRRGPAGWARRIQCIADDEERHLVERETVMFALQGVMARLGWRHVAWPANTAGKSAFAATKAATIMWQLVRDNAGPGALASAGRLVDGVTPGLSVGSDPNAGPVLSWACAAANLLTELQKLQPLAGGDFDLVPTGPATWAWQFFPGQRGSDRSASVVFAVERGNVAQARYALARSAGRTCVIVGGRGETADRRFRVRLASGHTAATHREIFFDARNAADTDAALDAQGDRVLDALTPRAVVSYDVIQTASCRFGVDYDIGDLVRYQLFGLTGVQQVTGAAVSLTPNQPEQIRVELRDV